MGTDVNTENKRKFLAQYYGQSIMRYRNDEEHGVFEVARLNVGIENAYIELKPLSSISDADAIVVGKILSNYSDDIKISRRENEIWCICDNYIKVVIGIITFGLLGKYIDGEPSETNNNFILDMTYHESEMITAIDFLRCRGYALPFRGLSIEEMETAGWIKLIQ